MRIILEAWVRVGRGKKLVARRELNATEISTLVFDKVLDTAAESLLDYSCERITHRITHRAHD